jgi:hypothetical protein
MVENKYCVKKNIVKKILNILFFLKSPSLVVCGLPVRGLSWRFDPLQTFGCGAW